jgi:hypothetical protein
VHLGGESVYSARVNLQAEENQSRKKLRLFAALGALVLAVFLIVTPAVAWNFYAVRAGVKWWAWSQRFKSEVLAQPASASGELKHIEWDGWGWAGQDTTVYLVFDPTDSLSTAAKSHQPGKFNGIPCEVAVVHLLESHWYSIQFYTNEFWGRRNVLDCGVPAH